VSAAATVSTAPPTVGARRRALAAEFRAAGIETPELDARVLLQAALGCDHAALAADSERVLREDEAARVDAFARRRLRREPVAYITGEKEFWGLRLRVTADTLIPRPETETVVEAALAALAPARHRQRLRVLDIATGSGALLIALLHELPNAYGVATDISLEALRVAQSNADRHGVSARAAFIRTDLTQSLCGRFDLIVANPPYIETAALAALAPEVREHEPRLALDGGADGLALYRRIAASVGTLLAPDGLVIMEVGLGQAEPVAVLFAASGTLANQPPAHDLAGIPRAVILSHGPAEKPPGA
jgi:release factor glutamine methyltransferase